MGGGVAIRWQGLWPNSRAAGFVLYKQTRWGFACDDARPGALAGLSLLIRAGFVIQLRTDLLSFNLDLVKSEVCCNFIHTPLLPVPPRASIRGPRAWSRGPVKGSGDRALLLHPGARRPGGQCAGSEPPLGLPPLATNCGPVGLPVATECRSRPRCPEPAGGTVLGKRVFADAVKDIEMRSRCLRVAPSPMTSVPVTGEESHRHRGDTT